MNCPHCGVEHNETAGRFCENCGMPVVAEGTGSCPHCGAAHAPEQGRFCDACGKSVYSYAKRDSGSATEEPEPGVEDKFAVRCRFCGTKARPPTCPSCGNRMPLPDDWVED